MLNRKCFQIKFEKLCPSNAFLLMLCILKSLVLMFCTACSSISIGIDYPFKFPSNPDWYRDCWCRLLIQKSPIKEITYRDVQQARGPKDIFINQIKIKSLFKSNLSNEILQWILWNMPVLHEIKTLRLRCPRRKAFDWHCFSKWTQPNFFNKLPL